MENNQERIIKQAHFADNLSRYWLTPLTIILILSIVGIPLLLLWLPLGSYFIQRYINNMSTELTSKKLVVRKGIFTRTENTVPLDKITDMALIQGPLMRFFKLHKLTIETAGQSGNGALLSLTGIVDVEEFRSLVLEQKEKLNQAKPSNNQDENNDASVISILQQISATLERIEANTNHNKND
ncbi:PH domain-containing protein [Shewanella fidelis]|uniref:PH domain-containing protein n=1 Tax=Shewanella fidelis TaxID=173509 RepID=A0AAW8NJ48_9GAMM|nr:PH domain-containing protein [Shewanella fidelis]MDR8522775.1 PH domain-containing protein [Shewanella fidelis]MDW4812390.1 PH domain-containing protein [Shewanella fidelis]MDW4815945.1 PH domain-containing protein [Shewanella fidelis]MDW4820631.1 PH domain-containing protein [Shewanella fidelis]MDW4824853.1 PH domain-containing protein [Shewanella fidelis]